MIFSKVLIDEISFRAKTKFHGEPAFSTFSCQNDEGQIWVGIMKLLFGVKSADKHFDLVFVRWLDLNDDGAYQETDKFDVLSLMDIEFRLCHLLPIKLMQGCYELNTNVHFSSPLFADFD